MASNQRDHGSEPQRLALQLPARTIGMALLGVLAAVVAMKLWPLSLLVLLALLVAVTLNPVVRWLARHGLPHWVAVLAVAAAMILLIAGFIVLVVPPLIEQGGALMKSMPKVRDDALAHLPDDGFMRQLLGKMTSADNLPEPGSILRNLFTYGGLAISVLTEAGIVLVIALYLLVDGDGTWRWLLPYFPPRYRAQLHQTASEVSEVIFAYVAGNIITSVVCALYTFVVLLVLHVPAALILAVLAGVLDILPIIGFILAVVPAVLLALTVSPTTALLVGVMYVIYHCIENYLLAPKIYGSRMRMSTLTVLLSLFAGTILAGVPGAIAVLPVVASYPIIERIWLAKWLGREVVAQHAAEVAKADPEVRSDPEAPKA